MLNAEKLRRYEDKYRTKNKSKNFKFWIDVFSINYSLKHTIKHTSFTCLAVLEDEVHNSLSVYKKYYQDKGFIVKYYNDYEDQIIIEWREKND